MLPLFKTEVERNPNIWYVHTHILTYTHLLMYALNIFGRINKKLLSLSLGRWVAWLGDRKAK